MTNVRERCAVELRALEAERARLDDILNPGPSEANPDVEADISTEDLLLCIGEMHDMAIVIHYEAHGEPARGDIA